MSSAPVLELKKAARTYETPGGMVRALRGVDFILECGEFVALTGPSGSGKSTMAHLCALLDKPSSGRVHFDGEDVTDLTDDERAARRKASVGMVFQTFCLLPHRSARDNVLFRFRYMDHIPHEAEQMADTALAEMGLTHVAHNQARLLSGGEMQRVAIARATVLRPEILVADEPTGNLDDQSAADVMACFRRLHDEGMTVLMVTHNKKIAAQCSREVICHNGLLRKEAL